MKLGVVILAAGQGTRMRSSTPKVLHLLAGRPLLEHVVNTATGLGAERISVVYGYGGDTVPSTLAHLDVSWARQEKQMGTGHAVEQALPDMAGMDQVLVLYGDVPLTRAETLRGLIEAGKATSLAVLTATLGNPHGYGRIVRDSRGRVLRIVEQKDGSAEELAIAEINTGILLADRGRLEAWLNKVENSNAQGEFYLTDVIALAVSEGVEVATFQPSDEDEILGVNDRTQLAHLERVWQLQAAERLMRAGVTLADPARYDQRGSVTTGADVFIDASVLFEGTIRLGDRVRIGPNTLIRNSTLGDDVEILSHCVIEDAVVGAGSRIGPYARLRPETELAENVHVGNFVEIKKSDVAKGSKINHLSYIGDTTIGSGVNIGAGTITCNYDGANKHRTVIGDGAFIGSDTQLVAPVEVGAGATIGAGSTITKNTPANQLTLSRSKQISIEGWQRPTKKDKA